MSSKSQTLHPQFLDGQYFADRAAEYSQHQTPERNAQRQANGKKSNVAPVVALLPGHEVAEDFFRTN